VDDGAAGEASEGDRSMTVDHSAGDVRNSGSPFGPGLDLPAGTDQPDPELARLVGALRQVQDSVVGAAPPAPVAAAVAELLEDISARLAPYRLPTDGPPSWDDLRRTAHTRVLGPVLEVSAVDRDSLQGTVTFTSFYLGGNGAAHGGAIPLFLDEVLGRLANSGRPICRTAYLNVDYRRVTPIGRKLRVEARFEREEGRKRYLHGALYDGEHLTAEGHGLFVELRAGAA
jgi:acyl-coenzyme A thioesterase PaaI-like protein